MSLAVHRNTPLLEVYDGRGLSIRQVAYLRKVAGTSVETLITRQQYDVAGRLIAQWDPRLFDHAPKPNLATVHGLSGQPIKVDSVDSGWRLSLAGLGGEILQRWDERGNRWRTTYDDLLRALTVDENTQQVEVFTYARGDADPGYNLRGQLRKKADPAGLIEFSRFSLHGLPFEETRTFPGGEVYTTAWSYGASGQPLSQTDARGHQQRSRYDIAGQLKQVTLQIDADGPVLDILKDAQYNAAGQISEQLAGNGVVSTWTYDPADGRLKNLKAGVPGQAPRQHLEYVYDPIGNVLRIDDHTFQTVFFANQRIDGHRAFTYDSLYRLTNATGHDATPPSDLPGRPLPSDPRNHLNYKQEYEYDAGGNLIKLIHGRAVGGYTHQMFIDPSSNRGVRWKKGDPAPDFSALFDLHGNLQALHPGQDLHWNSRDQLASVTLVKRDDAPNDEETYRYSHGARVYKRHETHASGTTHFHQVIYLPGLEIRTRDNGEELHVITVSGGRGSVRCLHWFCGQPDEIEADQLRYSLDDHLNSSLIELDQQARLISHEGYYPFGGTAWLTADSALEVSYKTIRYSGKEMDVSGLYYYGLRYYAPWLQRWVSADPAGDVDGLNLYAFVGNNPLSFVDILGLVRSNDSLNTRVSNRTTALIAGPLTHPLPQFKGTAKKIAERTTEHYTKHPDARFTSAYRGKVAVAHAGVEIIGPPPDDTISMTDFYNIPIPSELTLERDGVMLHSGPISHLNREEHPAADGIFKFGDLNLYTDHIQSSYINRLNDNTLPVKLYKGGVEQAGGLKGIQYEQPVLNPLIKTRIQGHIEASGRYLPKSAGLPGAHAEVMAGSLALNIQQSTGDADPSQIDVVTQILTGAKAAVAFPACFNCANILLKSYDNTPVFNVLTGRKPMTHSQWNSAVLDYR